MTDTKGHGLAVGDCQRGLDNLAHGLFAAQHGRRLRVSEKDESNGVGGVTRVQIR